MKAIIAPKYGGPEVLEVREIEKPTPRENEILIRVYATTVNRTDTGILSGKYLVMRLFTGLFKPRSAVPGTDFAGQVETIGIRVTQFKPGDRVWGFHDEGLASQAEYMTLKENAAVAHIPDGYSYAQAAASAEGAHYALNFIKHVPLKKGDKVLVYGATGAIGTAAVQLLKHYGAYVTAVVNGKNTLLAKTLGADKVINYETSNFTVDDERYHFVLDTVGKSTFGQCKPLLLPKEIYMSSELGPNWENLYLPIITKLKGGKRVVFPIPNNCKKSILFLNELIKKNEFKAVIDKSYTPNEAIEAYEYVASGQKTGNVIINF